MSARDETLEVDQSRLLQAASVRISHCDDKTCTELHIILFDDNDRPFAVVNVMEVDEFLAEVRRKLDRGCGRSQ